MRLNLLILFSLFSSYVSQAQNIEITKEAKIAFQNAYVNNPQIPKGLLEAISYTNTRLKVISSSEIQSCTGMPLPIGIMGLYLDGKNYFSNNLVQVALISGKSILDIQHSISIEINAYAKALFIIASSIERNQHPSFISFMKAVRQLNEIPLMERNPSQNYAKDAFLYQVNWFLKQTSFQTQFEFSAPNFDEVDFFGKENFKVLSSSYVTITKNNISGAGSNYTPEKSGTDYPLAISNPAASCNYGSRNGTSVTAVTIHTIQGTYASCISWFQNCSASVSAHYVVRSIDGQITQMVSEADKAYHVGSENSYTIGIEHEGFIDDASWYTNAMYASSADLCRDITTSGYGISSLRTINFPWADTTNYSQYSIPGTCVKIKGHQHFPNQTHTDPGPNWNWNYYYKLINNTTPVQLETAISGTIYDSGGSGGNYQNDERKIYTIQPSNATNLSIQFTQFSLESKWDYLYIYDGIDVFSTLIGFYSGTTSPGTIASTSGALTIEFRSDCATPEAGYAFNWTSTPPITDGTLVQSFSSNPQLGIVDESFFNLNVYPNPITSSITITMESDGNGTASIIDISGKVIQQFLLNTKETTVNVENLSAGIYILKIEDNGFQKSVKLIKE